MRQSASVGDIRAARRTGIGPAAVPITIAAPKLPPQASRANIAGGWAKIATNTHPDGVVFSVSNANVKGRAV